MRGVVAAFLGGILLAAPVATLACRWSCAEPAMLAAQEGCHEAPVAAVALTGANACAEHPPTEGPVVPLTRVAVEFPAADAPVILALRPFNLPAPGPARDHPIVPSRPPLALRI